MGFSATSSTLANRACATVAAAKIGLSVLRSRPAGLLGRRRARQGFGGHRCRSRLVIPPPVGDKIRPPRPRPRGASDPIVLLSFEIDDYDAWKTTFDQDPAGRRQHGAVSHKISRGVDNPNDVFIRVEFPSVDQAKAFRQSLVDSGALERAGARVKSGPTAAEVAEDSTY